MPVLSVNGIDLAYRDAGNGPPLVCVHGFADTSALWEPQMAALGGRYRFVAPDLRGHGQTSAPEDPRDYVIAHVLDDLLALSNHLGLKTIVLAGHSLGGYICLEFYRRHPERVAGLILLAAGIGYRNPAMMDRYNRSRRALGAKLLARARACEERGEPAIEPTTGSPLVGLANASSRLMQNPAALDLLPRITVPVLALVGENDPEYHAGTEVVRRRVPNVSAARISDAGHRLNDDQPDAVTAYFAKFLAGLEGPDWPSTEPA